MGSGIGVSTLPKQAGYPPDDPGSTVGLEPVRQDTACHGAAAPRQEGDDGQEEADAQEEAAESEAILWQQKMRLACLSPYNTALDFDPMALFNRKTQ